MIDIQTQIHLAGFGVVCIVVGIRVWAVYRVERRRQNGPK